MEKDTPNDTFTIKSNWPEHARQLRNKFSALADEELKFEKGDEDHLLTLLMVRLKKSRQEVIDILNDGPKGLTFIRIK